MIKDSNIIEKTCMDCGSKFTTTYGYSRKVSTDHHWRCKQCQSKYRSNLQKQSKTNISNIIKEKLNNPNERDKYIQMISERASTMWNNKSTIEREELLSKLRSGNKKYYESIQKELLNSRGKKLARFNSTKSEKLKQEHRKNISNGRIRYFQNLSNEEHDSYKNRYKTIWNNKTKEEKDIISNNAINQWKNYTDEERKRLIDILISNNIKRWENADEHYREEFGKKIHNGYISMDNETRQNLIKSRIDRWNNLTDEEKYLLISKSINNSKGKNYLHKKFENIFSDSIASNNFYIVEETIVSNVTSHSWDYGIYSKDNNELIMVVDLDGAYYHADNCDYDGIHSKEEYDERRSLSIPDGIKYSIIYENQFTKSFKIMLHSLILNYDDFINDIFKQCRLIPFPYPSFTDKELLKSYESLYKMDCNDKYHEDISLNTHIGDHIIQHFHHSIWHAHTKNKPSPYDAWNNDELLMKCINNRTIYQNHLNPNKILQGFNISKIATKVSVFSAGRAKLIINKYLQEYDIIFDPFSGFSGRMLGTISLGKKYIGQDISLDHTNESNNIIRFLYNNSIQLDATVIQQDILVSTGNYPCLFTCPPYGDKEQWVDTPVSNKSCDDWIDVCLKNFKCNRYVFIVDKTIKYQRYIINNIRNKSHFNKNNEYIILINKEDKNYE